MKDFLKSQDSLFTLYEYREDRGAHLEEIGRDQRLHMELAIYWSPRNMQRLLALVDTGAVCSLIYGNSDSFLGPAAYIDYSGVRLFRLKL